MFLGGAHTGGKVAEGNCLQCYGEGVLVIILIGGVGSNVVRGGRTGYNVVRRAGYNVVLRWRSSNMRECPGGSACPQSPRLGDCLVASLRARTGYNVVMGGVMVIVLTRGVGCHFDI